MNCEACRINKDVISQIYDENASPLKLCSECYKRVNKRSLRPLEFFNLASIHGCLCAPIHDDFYDEENGEAIQPQEEVEDIDLLPYPVFEQVKTNFNLLLDYAFARYDIEQRIIAELKFHNKHVVFDAIKQKLAYSRDVAHRAYQLAAYALGTDAADWIKTEWIAQNPREVSVFAEPISLVLSFDEGFAMLSQELSNRDDRYLKANVLYMCHFANEKVLDWIETQIIRTPHFGNDWGLLAAMSKFSWERTIKWLNSGRPLSLVALDALYFCLSGIQPNSPLLIRNNPPQLADKPDKEVIIKRLQLYLNIDNVPRTNSIISSIIQNLNRI